MSDAELLERISCDPQILLGKPVVKGTRLSVDYILGQLAHGATVDEIVAEYEGLTPDDVRACLLFAAQSVANVSFMPLGKES
jgi:uncharacterized protein (DUF433 family)